MDENNVQQIFVLKTPTGPAPGGSPGNPKPAAFASSLEEAALKAQKRVFTEKGELDISTYLAAYPLLKEKVGRYQKIPPSSQRALESYFNKKNIKVYNPSDIEKINDYVYYDLVLTILKGVSQELEGVLQGKEDGFKNHLKKIESQILFLQSQKTHVQNQSLIQTLDEQLQTLNTEKARLQKEMSDIAQKAQTPLQKVASMIQKTETLQADLIK